LEEVRVQLNQQQKEELCPLCFFSRDDLKSSRRWPTPYNEFRVYIQTGFIDNAFRVPK